VSAPKSQPRALYAEFERHRADSRQGESARHTDHWRAVHGARWSEEQVWAIIAHRRIRSQLGPRRAAVQMQADLVALGYQGSYNRVVAFERP